VALAVLTPTEGLNAPPVFLGILRTMARFEGLPPSDAGFNAALAAVEDETDFGGTIVRDENRNLLRNSRQYWLALDVLRPARGRIELTEFGRQVAASEITRTEFAIRTIRTLELPNERIERDTGEWESVNLSIKPLELILRVLLELDAEHGNEHAYITRDELVRIVIPLAGAQRPVGEHRRAIIQFREGRLTLAAWPDCAPEDNDPRMAREFMLFLHHYGFLGCAPGGTHAEDRFFLRARDTAFVRGLLELADAAPAHEETVISSEVDRQRVMREVLARPQQSHFRRRVMHSFESRCLVTGVGVPEALEAAHIVPVSQGGTDEAANGLCLRADLHLLFDSGHLRICEEGSVELSIRAAADTNYATLPDAVNLPDSVSREGLHWRRRYL